MDNTDEYLPNIDKIFDTMEGKPTAVKFTDRLSKYDLKIEEYLYFLSYALCFVDSVISRQSLDELFIEFYLNRENSYKKSEYFSSSLIFGSILPIFKGTIFIDIDKAHEWERNNEIDFNKYGMQSGNGYAQEYYDKHKIIDYKYGNLLKAFSDAKIYASLRKETITPLSALRNDKEKALEQARKIEEKRKEKIGYVDSETKNTLGLNENEKDKVDDSQEEQKYLLDILHSFFERNLLEFANKVKQKKETLDSDLKYILELIQEEIETFSNYLNDKVKVDDYISLTIREKVILSLFRLHNSGFQELRQSSIARAIAIEYGRDKETYRDIIKEIINNPLGSQEFKNIESMIKCIQRGTSKANMDKGDKIYKEIKNFNQISLRKLLQK